jgi:hypothetical protein
MADNNVNAAVGNNANNPNQAGQPDINPNIPGGGGGPGGLGVGAAGMGGVGGAIPFYGGLGQPGYGGVPNMGPGFGMGYAGPGGFGGYAQQGYGNMPGQQGVGNMGGVPFNAPFNNPFMNNNFNIRMNHFDGNYGNYGQYGGVYGGGYPNVVMGNIGNMQHHSGFGPAPGPGTGGRDADGNIYLPNGQYAPGGNLTIRHSLSVCGFQGNELNTLVEHLPTFDALRVLQAENITSMEKNMASARENPIVMQTWRTTLLKGLMYWVQDNDRCGRNPEMAHNLTQNMLRDAINRADARKRAIERQSALSADTAPSQFKEGDDFYRWAETMYNHLNTILGVKDIPLSYVIRTNPPVRVPFGV